MLLLLLLLLLHRFEADQEAVFSMAFLLKINQKKMRRLEKEYTTMKSKEKEDEIELRVGDDSIDKQI